MSPFAPVVRQVPRGVFHHANPDIVDFKCAPDSLSGRTRVFGGGTLLQSIVPKGTS